MAHPGYRKGGLVKVRIDESDVSRAWVTDPFTRIQEPLEPVDADYMTGLTLYQHRMALLWSDENMDGARDAASLMEARARLDEEVEALNEGKAKRKKSYPAAARHKNTQVERPSRVRDPAPPKRVETDVAADLSEDDEEEMPPMREVRKKPGPAARKDSRP